jgi:hypothetical protein
MNGPFSTLKSKQKEFFVELAKHGVDYVVVGGYAMRFHGLYRDTKDLNLLIGYEPENAEKLVPIIKRYGTVGPVEIKERLTKPDVHVPIDGIDVELFTKIWERVLPAKKGVSAIDTNPFNFALRARKNYPQQYFQSEINSYKT